MRLNYKIVLTIVFVAVFSTLIVVDLGSAGTLRHRIFSPFNTLVAEDEDTYTSTISSEPETSSASSKYQKFEEYENSLAGHEDEDEYDPGLPYCMIGGQYMINVYNNASPAKKSKDDNIPIVFDEDYKIFYCKTTLDLLERVKIPLSWENNSLLIYCNDGGHIYSNETNFDFITSQMNTYKACVVRNLDEDYNNTLIYGYDVGNKVVDNFEEYFFNNDSKNGPVLVGMEHLSDVKEIVGESTAYAGKYQVPYKKVTHTQDSGMGYGVETVTEITWEPRNASEAVEYLISQNDNLDENILVFHQSDNVVTKRVWYIDDYETEVSGDSYSIYTLRIPYTYTIGEYLFNYSKTNRPYYFGYDYNDKFYYMKDFNDSLSLPILKVFPEADPQLAHSDLELGLSRVILFKKIGDKYIYGYEKVSNSVSSEEPYNISIKPVYKIKLENFDFVQQRCVDLLMKYSPSRNDFSSTSGVSCSNGGEISIASVNVDANENDEKYSFHLFKNIVTYLK